MKKSLRLFILTISLLSFSITSVFAGAMDPVLAKVLIKVVRNTRWNQKTITICTYGSSRVGSILQEISNNFESSGNVRRIIVIDKIEKKDFGKCHVLYIVSDKEDELSFILKEIGNKSILTISDMEDFTENNGMVGIGIGRRNNLIIKFNEEAIAKSNIRIDPVFLLDH